MAYYSNTRPEIAVFLPPGVTRMLELGCGEGGFAANVGPDVECWGIELDPVAAERAKRRYHTVLIGDVMDCLTHIPEGVFDVVICNDVLEHLVQPGEVLQRLQTKLAPNGCVIGSIPNVRFFDNLVNLFIKKEWRYEDEGVLDRTHLRFFTEKSLRRLFEENGYRVDVFQGINGYARSWKFSLRLYPKKNTP